MTDYNDAYCLTFFFERLDKAAQDQGWLIQIRAIGRSYCCHADALVREMVDPSANGEISKSGADAKVLID